MNPEDLVALRGLYQQNPKLFTQSDLTQLRALGAELPEQEGEENDDFSLLGTISQIGQGFIQGFTTINIGDEPRNTVEAVARNVGNVFGFLGIVPGAGTAGKIAASALTRSVSATASLIGKTDAAADVLKASAKAGDVIKNFAVGEGEMFGKKYRRLNSVPFMVASYGMQGMRKVLPPNAVKFMGETKLGTAASEAFITGLASGVSSWSYGGREMLSAATIGAIEGGAFRGVANFIPGREGTAVALRAFVNSAFAAGSASLAGAPVPIVAYHALLGAAFGVDDLPFSEIQARNYLLRKSEQGSDLLSKRRSLIESIDDPEMESFSPEVKDIIRGEVEATLARSVKTMFGDQEVSVSAAEGLALIAMQKAAAGDRQGAIESALTAYYARIASGIDQDMSKFIDEQVAKDAADKAKRSGEPNPEAEAEATIIERKSKINSNNKIEAEKLLDQIDEAAAEAYKKGADPISADAQREQVEIAQDDSGARSETVVSNVDAFNAAVDDFIASQPTGAPDEIRALDSFDAAIKEGGSFLDELMSGINKFNEEYRLIQETDIAVRTSLEDHDLPSEFRGPFVRISTQMGPNYLDKVKGIAASVAEDARTGSVPITPTSLDNYVKRLEDIIDINEEPGRAEYLKRYLNREGKEAVLSTMLLYANGQQKPKLVARQRKNTKKKNFIFDFDTAGTSRDIYPEILPNGQKISERYVPSMLEKILSSNGADVRHLSIDVEGDDILLTDDKSIGIMTSLMEKGWYLVGAKKDTGNLVVTNKPLWSDDVGEGKAYASVEAAIDDILPQGIKEQLPKLASIDLFVNRRTGKTADPAKRFNLNNHYLNNIYWLASLYGGRVPVPGERLVSAQDVKSFFKNIGPNDRIWKNPNDVTKRMQVFLDPNIPAPKSYFEGITTLDGQSTYDQTGTIPTAYYNDFDGEGNTILRGYGNYKDETGKTFEEVTDGSVIMEPELFDRYRNLMGIDEKSTVLKMSFAYNGEVDDNGLQLGAAVNKGAIVKASDEMAEAMRSRGIGMLVPKSAGKITGKRTINNLSFSVKNKKLQIDNKTISIYNTPIDSARINPGSSQKKRAAITWQERKDGKLRPVSNQYLPVQIAKAIDKAEAPEAFEAYKNLYVEPASKGDGGSTYARAMQGDYTDFNIKNLSVPEILSVILAKNHTPQSERLFGEIAHQIIFKRTSKPSGDDEPIRDDGGTAPPDISEDSAAGIKDMNELSAAELQLSAFRDRPDLLEPFILLGPYGDYVNQVLKNYVNNRIQRPTFTHGGQALLSPLGTPDVQFSVKKQLGDTKWSSKIYGGKISNALKNGTIPQGYVVLDAGLRDVVVKYGDEDVKLGTLWGRYIKGQNTLSKAELSAMEEAMTGLYARIPMAEASGARNLKLAGFIGKNYEGYGIHLHGLDMNMLGGADLDGDKAFLIFDIDKNGGKQGPIRKFFDSRKNDRIKAGTKDVVLPIKDPVYDDFFLDKVDPMYQGIVGAISPIAMLRSGTSAYQGNRSIGVFAKNTARIKQLFSGVVKEGGTEYLTRDLGNGEVLYYALKPNAREAVTKLNSDAVQRSADAADQWLKFEFFSASEKIQKSIFQYHTKHFVLFDGKKKRRLDPGDPNDRALFYPRWKDLDALKVYEDVDQGFSKRGEDLSGTIARASKINPDDIYSAAYLGYGTLADPLLSADAFNYIRTAKADLIDYGDGITDWIKEPFNSYIPGGVDYDAVVRMFSDLTNKKFLDGYALIAPRAALKVAKGDLDAPYYTNALSAAADLETARAMFSMSDLALRASESLGGVRYRDNRQKSKRVSDVVQEVYNIKQQISEGYENRSKPGSPGVQDAINNLDGLHSVAMMESPVLAQLVRQLVISPLRGHADLGALRTGISKLARKWSVLSPDDFRQYYEAQRMVRDAYAREHGFSLATVVDGTASSVQDAPVGSLASHVVGDMSSPSVATAPAQRARESGIDYDRTKDMVTRVDQQEQKVKIANALKTTEAIKEALTKEGYLDTSTKKGRRGKEMLDRMDNLLNRFPHLAEHLVDIFPYATGEFSMFAPSVALDAATYEDLQRFVGFFERSFDRGFITNLIEKAMDGDDSQYPKLAMARFPDTVARMMRAEDMMITSRSVMRKVVTRSGIKDLPVRAVFSTGDELANVFAKANSMEAELVPMQKKKISKTVIEPLEDGGANPDADVMFRMMTDIRQIRDFVKSGDLTQDQVMDMIRSDKKIVEIKGKAYTVPEEIMRFRKYADKYDEIKDNKYGWRDAEGNRILLSGKEIVGEIGYGVKRRLEDGSINPDYDVRKAGFGNEAITKFYEDFYNNHIGDYSKGLAAIPKQDAPFIKLDLEGNVDYLNSIRAIRRYIVENNKMPELTYNGAALLQYEAELRNYTNVTLRTNANSITPAIIEKAKSLGVKIAPMEAGNRFVQLTGPISFLNALGVVKEGTVINYGRKYGTRVRRDEKDSINAVVNMLRDATGGFSYQQPRYINVEIAPGMDVAVRKNKTRISKTGAIDHDVYWSRIDHDQDVVQEYVKTIPLPVGPAARRALGLHLKQMLYRGKITTEILSPELRRLVYDKNDFATEDPRFTEQIVRKPPNVQERSQIPLPGWSDDSSVLGKYAQSTIEGQAKMLSIVLAQDSMTRFQRRASNDLPFDQVSAWKNWLKTYTQSYLGVSSLNNEVMAGGESKVPGNLGVFTSDASVFNKFREFDRRFLGGRFIQKKIDAEVQKGADPKIAEEIVKGRSSEWLRSLSRMEARFQLVTLLANSRSLVNNIVGGNATTITSVGLRPLLRAMSGRELSRISDDFATPAKRMEFAEKAGAIETYMAREAELSGNFGTATAKAFLNDAIRAVKKNPSLKDSELLKLARQRGLTDRFVNTAGWFMRYSERLVRTHSFFAHYLKARDIYGATSFTKHDDQFLIEMAKKGADATQFLYNSASRPIASATPIGKIFSRFQLYAWNSIKYRRDIYQQAKQIGFRPDTVEFNRFKTLAAADLFMFGLAAVLPFSTFAATIPSPFGALNQLSSFFFGDEEERDGAFYGILPYPANIIGLASPPGMRLLTMPIKGSMALFDYLMLNTSDDLEFFLQYDMMSLIPFGSLIRNSYKTYNSPQMAVEFLTGLPLHGLARYHNDNMDKQELYKIPIGNARLAVEAMTDVEKRQRRKEIRESNMVEAPEMENSDEQLTSMVESELEDFNAVIE